MAKRSSSVSKTKLELHRVAHYTFFVGLLVAIVAGLLKDVLFTGLSGQQVIVTTLVVLGTLIGLFNLTAKETTPFLVAAIALMLAGIVNLSLIPEVGTYLRAILTNIVVFVVPGAIIVGLKAVWKLASD